MKNAGKLASIPFKIIHRVFGAFAFMLILGLAGAGALVLAVVLLGAGLFALLGVGLWLIVTSLCAFIGGGLIAAARVFDPEYSAKNTAEALQKAFTETAAKVVH
jgi:hypothetical protein